MLNQLKKIILIKLDLLIFQLALHFEILNNDFIRSNFFPYKNKYDLKKLKNLLKNENYITIILNNFEIKDISSLNLLRDNSLLFLEADLKISEINKKNIHIITNN